MSLDAITLSLPAVLAAGFAVMVCLAGLTSWIHATFERKDDASFRHEEIKQSIAEKEKILRDVAEDVSYIRGRIEK